MTKQDKTKQKTPQHALLKAVCKRAVLAHAGGRWEPAAISTSGCSRAAAYFLQSPNQNAPQEAHVLLGQTGKIEHGIGISGTHQRRSLRERSPPWIGWSSLTFNY